MVQEQPSYTAKPSAQAVGGKQAEPLGPACLATPDRQPVREQLLTASISALVADDMAAAPSLPCVKSQTSVSSKYSILSPCFEDSYFHPVS